jgi:hypothetical protein
MAFCGQCGFLLPPDAVSCPRCKSAVTSSWAAADKNANAPTVISTPYKTEKAEKSSSSKPDLVQEPNQSVDYKTEALRTEQDKHTPPPPTPPTPPTIQHLPSAGHDAQPPIAPPPPDTILQKDIDIPSTYNNLHTNSTSIIHGAPGPGNAFSTVAAYPPPVPPQKTKHWATLLITLLILFLVGAIVLIIGPDRIIQMVRGGIITPQTTPVPPTSQVPTSVPPTPTAQSSSTPEQQAQSVVDRYYTAINSNDYQTAYNLWQNYPESYQNFANGFRDTSHDDYTFGNVVQQSESKVRVNITITATSISYQQTSYQGYYIVEQQQDGSWKITSAKIHKV